MATIGSTKSPFKIFYGENLKIIGLLSDFGRIGYFTKRKKFKKKMTEKKFKAIMFGYGRNHMRDTYKL